MAEPDRLQPLAAGAAEEDRELVADQLAAAAGEDGRQAGQARPLLLAARNREPPDGATVWKHGAADRLAALASRVGEPTTGSDFLWGSQTGQNDPFRGLSKHLALRTRLPAALGTGQEELLGRRKMDNGNSG